MNNIQKNDLKNDIKTLSEIESYILYDGTDKHYCDEHLRILSEKYNFSVKPEFFGDYLFAKIDILNQFRQSILAKNNGVYLNALELAKILLDNKDHKVQIEATFHGVGDGDGDYTDIVSIKKSDILVKNDEGNETIIFKVNI